MMIFVSLITNGCNSTVYFSSACFVYCVEYLSCYTHERQHTDDRIFYTHVTSTNFLSYVIMKFVLVYVSYTNNLV